jgi:hypothetical protein
MRYVARPKHGRPRARQHSKQWTCGFLVGEMGLSHESKMASLLSEPRLCLHADQMGAVVCNAKLWAWWESRWPSSS